MKKDWIIISLFGLSLVLLIASSILVFAGLSGVDGAIVIHFDFRGEPDFINGVSVLWNIILSAGFMSFVNVILAYILYNREKILSYVLASGTVLLTILILVIIFTIVSIN